MFRWIAISLLVLMCLAGCGGTVQMHADLGGTEEALEYPPDVPKGW